MSKEPTEYPAQDTSMKNPLEYPNITPDGLTMHHYCDDHGRILGGIWQNSITKEFRSYVACSGERVQNHPTFEAAYIALKLRIK